MGRNTVINGKKVIEWAEGDVARADLITRRLKTGWTLEDALKPVMTTSAAASRAARKSSWKGQTLKNSRFW